LERGHGWREVLDLYRQAAEGLAAAHEAGIIHRDFKPANVILGPDGRVVVLDFGVARLAAVPDASLPMDRPVAHLGTTTAGSMVGTPAYMAPEQLNGDDVSAGSDQFSLCVALYEALHGERPFAGRHVLELLDAIRKGKFGRVVGSDGVPAWLDGALRRGLAAEADARHPSLAALLEALTPPPPRGRKFAALAGAAALIGVVAAGVAARPDAAEKCILSGQRSDATVWNEAGRAELEATFLASGRPHAAATFERIARRVSAQVDAWREIQRETCEATHDQHTLGEDSLERRIACLDRQRREAEGVLKVLGEAS
ncbi:MAG: serine/threonine protein kinase, partial [Bosea sp.]|uniref:serine/threonine-protein kinase n=1 Tax=Bosea sp. (in: a-proteobacteria) TaxID=1871050 RepID=UPI00238CFB0C|nr:serine/threonine protein kinase [Bosea sp. (in: a-proteobacteria)]